MMRKLADIDITNNDHINNINENWLDLDTLLKAVALEYLAGHWDSYWFLTSNFVTYHPAEETAGEKYDHSKYKYYFVDQDFDQTWSVGMNEKLEPEIFPTKRYTEFVGKDASYWKSVNRYEDAEPGTRVIIDKLIGCDGLDTCPTKVKFENHLKSIVKYIFNPEDLGRKVNGYKERLDEEMKWDTSLTRLHKGTKGTYHFTYNDFINGIEYGVSSSYGIMDWTKIMADTVCQQFNMVYGSNSEEPVNQNDQSMNDTIANNVLNSNNVNTSPNQDKTMPNSDSAAMSIHNISMTFTIFILFLSFVLYI